MAHSGQEPTNLPRIAFQVSLDLKKRLENFTTQKRMSTKDVMTTLLEKLLAGKIKL